MTTRQRSATKGLPNENRQLDVSIVMPCLNEEDSVAACVREARGWIDRSGMSGEVIVVDNGSTDRSAELAAQAGARVVQEPRPGYGSALLRGFEEARGTYLVMGDCDGTYEFEKLEPLVGPLRDGYELVVGNRLTPMLAPGAMPWAHRVIGTPLISYILRLFSGARIKDSQCGLRAIQKEAYERLRLKATGMEFASEMILKAVRQGLRITEVPIAYNARVGESKLSTFRDGWRHLRFLLITSPSYVFIAPGLVFLILGLISLAVSIFTTSGVAVGSLRWHPIFAAGIFLVIGINTMMLGLCSKLFAQRRPEPEDAIVRFYRRYLGLERLLAIAVATAAVGVGLDIFILIEWATHSGRDLLPMATVSQSLLVIGANLIFAALAAALIDYDQS